MKIVQTRGFHRRLTTAIAGAVALLFSSFFFFRLVYIDEAGRGGMGGQILACGGVRSTWRQRGDGQRFGCGKWSSELRSVA